MVDLDVISWRLGEEAHAWIISRAQVLIALNSCKAELSRRACSSSVASILLSNPMRIVGCNCTDKSARDD